MKLNWKLAAYSVAQMIKKEKGYIQVLKPQLKNFFVQEFEWVQNNLFKILLANSTIER